MRTGSPASPLHWAQHGIGKGDCSHISLGGGKANGWPSRVTPGGRADLPSGCQNCHRIPKGMPAGEPLSGKASLEVPHSPEKGKQLPPLHEGADLPSPSLIEVSNPHTDQGQTPPCPSPRLLLGMWQHPVGRDTDKRDTETGKDTYASAREAERPQGWTATPTDRPGLRDPWGDRDK